MNRCVIPCVIAIALFSASPAFSDTPAEAPLQPAMMDAFLPVTPHGAEPPVAPVVGIGNPKAAQVDYFSPGRHGAQVDYFSPGPHGAEPPPAPKAAQVDYFSPGPHGAEPPPAPKPRVSPVLLPSQPVHGSDPVVNPGQN